MIEIDTLFQTKTATKNIAFGAAYTYIAYRDHPTLPPPPGQKSRCRLLVSLLTQVRLKIHILESIFLAKQELLRMHDFAASKNFSFNQCHKKEF